MNTRKNMKHAAALAMILGAAGGAMAQDRMVEAIGITPTPGVSGPFFDVTAVWSIGVAESTASLNLSGILELRVNGDVVDRLIFNAGTNGLSGFCGIGGPGCGGGCGTGYVDGIFAGALLCIYDGPIEPGVPDCDCKFPSITWEVPSVPLVPGDTVEVVYVPTGGSHPDPFTPNNFKRLTFDGIGNYWGRTIEDVRVLPSPNGQPGKRIEVESIAWGHLNGVYNMSGQLVLIVNGVQVATTHSATDWISAGACVGSACQSNPCAVDINGNPLAYCAINGPETCVPDCGWDSFNPNGPEFTNILLEPGDEVLVVFIPGDGALPELPGLPSDNEHGMTFCPGDITGDAKVDVDDLNAVLSQWGQQVEAGAGADLTGNGKVDVDDLNEVLSKWGSVCIAV